MSQINRIDTDEDENESIRDESGSPSGGILSNYPLHLRSSCSFDSLFRESKFVHLRCAAVVVGFLPDVGTLPPACFSSPGIDPHRELGKLSP